MPPNKSAALPAAILAVATLAACSTGTAGTPTIAIGSSPADSSATGGSPTSSASLSPRPKTIKIDKLDPCLVLLPDQQKALGLDREPHMILDTKGDKFGNKPCDFARSFTEPNYSFSITPVPQEGADAWLREKRNVEVRMLEPLVGFGAVEVVLAGAPRHVRFCHVIVDIADGQSIDVQFAYEGTDTKAFTREQACGKARDAAEMAVTTLLRVA